MDACTIIASNYCAFARVLARSFKQHHPEGRFFALVIDDHRGRIDPAQEPFELITPEHLGIERFDMMATLYSVLELSTAVKPWLLRHLLHERGSQALLYLDPDIEVHDSLEEIAGLLAEHRVVVTPHLTAPMPRDGRRPSETDILIAGSYNLGFIGLAPGPDTDELLGWWAERLETDCIVAPERGYFVDQRWMDFMPGLVPSFYVLRDPGYNVAYWNLPNRTLGRDGGRYTVNGRPLRFMHYSGFDPEEPLKLSKHQDRVEVSRDPVLRELCAGYARRLLSDGHREARSWPYTYDRLGDGTPIDPVLRRAARNAFQSGELRGDVLTPEGARQLLRWVTQPAEHGAAHGVNRYLYGLWDMRPDIQGAFPNLDGVDGERFVAWATVFARAEMGLPGHLLGGDANGDARWAPLGVNLVGYLDSVLGVGEAGRQYAAALETQGVAVKRMTLDAERSRKDPDLAPGSGLTGVEHAINFVAVNADVFAAFARDAGPEFFRDRYTIGHWAWEVTTFPDRWMPAFEHVDEVWVGSDFVAEVLQAVSPVPVVKIREPLQLPAPPSRSRAELGLPEGFLFLFSFDYNSVFARKNPLAVIEAFSQAFEPGSGPQLVIKSINAEHDEPSAARVREAAAARPDIHVIDRHVSREDRDAMVASCDCYVSLHRSEGFGYTVAEALALERPVISTGWSGTMEFTDHRNAFLVDYELVPVGPGADPYPADAQWAEPSIEHAAALMREVVEHPEEAARRAQRGARDVARLLGPEPVGRAMVERLRNITYPGIPRRSDGLGRGVVDTERLRARISTGPAPPGNPRFGKPQAIARKAVLRTMKPLAVHEKIVSAEIVQNLEVLDRAVQGLTSMHAATHARTDELTRQVDELRADVHRVLGLVSAFGPGEDPLSLGELPAAPEQPWSPEWVDAHRRYVTRLMDDPALLSALRRGKPLPAGLGVGYDERIVEFPWTLSRDLGGRVLDAGSTLNHPHVLTRVLPRVDDLHIATLAPEPDSFPSLDVSYLYADLRDLPIKDETYDRVTCISTLEHVGMDNSQYGASAERSADAGADMQRAVRELRRVLRPGGAAYITVPYGRPDDLDWQQIFDAPRLERLVKAFEPAEETREFFLYEPGGWRRAEESECAGAVYRDHTRTPEAAEDRAVAARAIACLTLRA